MANDIKCDSYMYIKKKKSTIMRLKLKGCLIKTIYNFTTQISIF